MPSLPRRLGLKEVEAIWLEAAGEPEAEVLTLPEYRSRVDAERSERGPNEGLRGLHHDLDTGKVNVPGASHRQLVRTEECYWPGCPDHGWM